MKIRIIKNLLALLMVVSFTACEKRLDIEPTQSVDESMALRTSSDVEAALIGAYNNAGDGDVLGGNAKVNQELLGAFNEINWSGTFQGMTQMYNKSIPVNNAFITATWTNTYDAINTVNNVLSAMDKVDDAKKDKVEGESRFLRALMYYELVNMYARDWSDGDPNNNPGVPIILEPTREINEASQVARHSVAEVYNQVISDLSIAKEKLPETNGLFFPTTYAASALLARVYLQQNEYANAATEADRVIKSDEFELTNTYAESFPAPFPFAPRPNTREEIFAMQVNTTTGINDFNTYFSSNGRADIDITEAHLSLYEAGDARRDLFYEDGSTFTGKHENQYGNVTIIRLAEMYLIRAEANFRLRPNDPIGGVDPADDINLLRARVGLDPIAAADLTLAMILKERKLELAFEGFALQDAKRLKLDVGSLPWNSPKLIFPIPEREILVNKQLEQNEGY